MHFIIVGSILLIFGLSWVLYIMVTKAWATSLPLFAIAAGIILLLTGAIWKIFHSK